MLRFHIPDINVSLSEREDTLLTLELEALRHEGAPYDAAAALELLDQERRHRGVIDLTTVTNETMYAFARAVDHLRAFTPSLLENDGVERFPVELGRLGDAVRAWVGLQGSAIAYPLIENTQQYDEPFVSRTGPYGVGDRLVVHGGQPYTVDEVRPGDDADTLVVSSRPAPQTPDFSTRFTAVPQSISVDNATAIALAAALRERGAWLLAANLSLATQLFSGLTVPINRHDAELLLQTINGLEDTSDVSVTYVRSRLSKALAAEQ
jgi:hypothetical protein